MRNGTKIMSLAAVAAMVLTASLALAGPAGQGRGAGYAYAPRAAQLSPEKQAAFQKLRAAHYTKTVQMRAELRVKRAQLNAAAVAPTPDMAKIDALAKEIGTLQGQLLTERTHFRVQVAKEIGPEVAAHLRGHRGHGFRGHAAHRGGRGF